MKAAVLGIIIIIIECTRDQCVYVVVGQERVTAAAALLININR